MIAAAVPVPVAVNVTGEPANPGALAVTELEPAVSPTVSVLSAWPVASLVALVAERSPPPLSTAKTTVTPATGFPCASLTVTTNGSGSVVPTSALWSFPDSIWIVGVRPDTGATVPHPLASTAPNNAIAHAHRIHPLWGRMSLRLLQSC